MKLDSKLKNIFSKVLKVPIKNITDLTSPNNCSSWDSFNMLNLVIAIEDKFSIKLEIEEAVTIKSFKDALSLVESKISQ